MKIKKSNYQDLLKLIALIVMVIDHLGLYIFPEILLMRGIGRFAMPIFCFFAGYNFDGRPRLRVLMYGVLLYAFSSYFIFQGFVVTNILISIFFGQVYLWLFNRTMRSFESTYVHLVILGVLWTVTRELIDYGTLAAAIMVAGYMARTRLIAINVAAAIIAYLSILHSFVNFWSFLDVSFIVGAGFSAILVYVVLSIRDFKKVINYNLAIITRHSAIIYCLQFMLIETYWRYIILQ